MNIKQLGFIATILLDRIGSILDYKQVRKNKKELSRALSTAPHFLDLNEILIEDRVGLEHILNRTRNAEDKEWATILSYENDKRTVRITKICNSHQVYDLGLYELIRDGDGIAWSKNLTIFERVRKAFGIGADGNHHYHPRIESLDCFSARNYIINSIDRSVGFGLYSVNLLSFNIDGKPELIGYTIVDTFIPKNDSKNHLIKATKKDILRYLGRRNR